MSEQARKQKSKIAHYFPRVQLAVG